MARIEQAAMELIREGGVDAVSIQGVVKRARSSVGSFYARFQSREHLLDHLRARSAEGALERWDAALDAVREEMASLPEAVDKASRLVVEALRQEGALEEFLRGPSPVDGERLSPLTDRMLSTLRPLVLAHRTEIEHEVPEVAVEVGLRILVASAGSLLRHPVYDEEGTPLDREALVNELGLCYLRYLGEGGMGSRDVPGTDTLDGDPFDVWA
jgi:AcrR family transcriptional regulator